MTHYRTGNHNSRNLYRVENGTDTHVGCAFAETDGPRWATALNQFLAPDHRTPAGHYRRAEGYLEAAYDHFRDSTRADRPHTERDEAALACQMLTGMATAHAQLATAGAAAMHTLARYLGDSAVTTEMAHAVGWDSGCRRPTVTDEEPMRA